MPEPIEYGFADRLAFSDGHVSVASVEAICMEQIPGAVAVDRATERDDRNGTDWWVRRNGVRPLSIDAKVRSEDWAAKPNPQDDLALETWSVVEQRVVGWTRNPKKDTDYILWLWIDTRRWCLVSFPMLCAVMETLWQEWASTYKVSRQTTPRSDGTKYHSECVFVPRREVWKQIYLRYAGAAPSSRLQPTNGT